MSQNWEAFGIAWESEVVSRQAGPNKTDRVAFSTHAQLPKISDFDKFTEHFGKPAVLAMFNASNSLRVRAQAVCRGLLEQGVKDTDALRQAVYNAMRGVRATATPVQVRVYTLPNGQLYNGQDVMEYRQLYVSALVEAGVDAQVAITLANTQTLG
jgi:hypothetical protein